MVFVLYQVTFLNSIINSHHFKIDPHRFSMYTILSSANSDKFVSLFPKVITLF